ncbi:MAG: hypothetical protein R2867_27525 [Caldilineaceae bacterium]
MTGISRARWRAHTDDKATTPGTPCGDWRWVHRTGLTAPHAVPPRGHAPDGVPAPTTLCHPGHAVRRFTLGSSSRLTAPHAMPPRIPRARWRARTGDTVSPRTRRAAIYIGFIERD